MITTKIYPEIEVRATEEHLMLSTYVRIKRANQYWLLFLTDKYNVPQPCHPRDVSNMYKSFIESVYRNRHMYIIDEDSLYFDSCLKKKTIIKDFNHLTERERFLTTIKLP